MNGKRAKQLRKVAKYLLEINKQEVKNGGEAKNLNERSIYQKLKKYYRINRGKTYNV